MVSIDEEFKKLVEGGEIVEQLDYKALLWQQLRICQIASLYGLGAFKQSVMTLLAQIPKQDWDEEFVKDIEKCKYKILVGTSQYVQDVTHDRKTEIEIEKTEYDWMQLLHSIINLLRRKGVLWREKEVETIS